MNTTPLNPAALDSLNTIGPDLLATLAGIYLADTPTVLMDLRTAVTTTDLLAIRLLKHRLKGSSGVFGADGLVALCDAFEATTDLPAWLHALETEYTRVAAALASAQTRVAGALA